MNAKEFAHELEKAASFIRQQQAEIETYKLELYDEVMLRRKQQSEIEALKTELHKYKPQIWEVMKEAKYGITTKWNERTTYHETTEPIGKAQEK